MSSDVEYRIHYQHRRTLGLYVQPDGEVEVRAPHRTPASTIRRFVAARSDWIERRRADCAARPNAGASPYSDGARHYFRGEELALRIVDGRRRSAVRESGQLIVTQRAYAGEDTTRELVRDWYRGQAREQLPQRAEELARAFVGYAPVRPSFSVRRMRSRWGSCSADGRIRFNSWLLRLPEACIDAVVVHELCHLLEMNHSPRFYRWMDHFLPDWRERDDRLKRHPGRHLWQL